MTPYTEAAFIPTGTSVLNTSDVNALTTSVRALPNIVQMMTAAIKDSVEVAIAAPATGTGTGENLTLNLVIKMNEREVASVAKKVSMETMRRGLEIVT